MKRKRPEWCEQADKHAMAQVRKRWHPHYEGEGPTVAERALANATQRQVWRAVEGDITALEQISTAWVLHVDQAWANFKGQLRVLFTLRCPACSRRHWRKPVIEYRNGRDMSQGGLHCGNGWSATYWWRATVGGLLHGED